MYGSNLPPPMRMSPSDYMMQKRQAMEAEKRSMRVSVTKLALLMIIYNVLNYAAVRLFYMIVYSVVSKSVTLSLYTAVNGMREEHAEMLKGTSFKMGAMLFTVVLSALGVFFTAQVVLGVDLASYFVPSKKKVRDGLIWSPPCITVNLIMSVFISLIVKMLSDEGVNVPSADFSIKSPSTLALVMQFLYVCLAGPVVEELVYRGVVIKLLAPYGKGLAVFVSALFFGLMHGNLEQTVPTFIGGLLFASVAVYSDSIVPTIIIHVANNTIASINDFGKAVGKDFSKLYLAISIPLMVVGFYVLIVFLIDMLKEMSKNSNYAMPASKRTLTVFLNVLMVAYVGICLIYPYIMSFVNSN